MELRTSGTLETKTAASVVVRVSWQNRAEHTAGASYARVLQMDLAVKSSSLQTGHAARVLLCVKDAPIVGFISSLFPSDFEKLQETRAAV